MGGKQRTLIRNGFLQVAAHTSLTSKNLEALYAHTAFASPCGRFLHGMAVIELLEAGVLHQQGVLGQIVLRDADTIEQRNAAGDTKACMMLLNILTQADNRQACDPKVRADKRPKYNPLTLDVRVKNLKDKREQVMQAVLTYPVLSSS